MPEDINDKALHFSNRDIINEKTISNDQQVVNMQSEPKNKVIFCCENLHRPSVELRQSLKRPWEKSTSIFSLRNAQKLLRTLFSMPKMDIMIT
jgi:hypothetical protein